MLKKEQFKTAHSYPLGGTGIHRDEYYLPLNCGDSIIVVDCGLAFPEDDMYGIDLLRAGISRTCRENIDRVKGFFITHGHEDHIGALPYVLLEVNVPIYATKLTNGLIEHKLEEHGLLDKVKRKVVKYGQHINLGCFRVEFVKTNPQHPGCGLALAIYTPAGVIMHTGDFKVGLYPRFTGTPSICSVSERSGKRASLL